jgi:sulfite reductase (ferredoxin)
MPETIANRVLAERMESVPPDIQRELDVFAIELRRYRDGQVPENVFTEFRLRHGVYGQRQDGVQMIRIKIPYGALTTEQMDTLADLCEEIADGICHVTTRQDIQLHFVKIADTPMMMNRLAAVGITTREACGNVVRNVTGCPIAGTCPDEAFDVTPYAKALAYYLLRHPELQNFGRKFKIAFSGCHDKPCGLANMHDIGAIAVTREENGVTRRGFRLLVGGGLGAVPHQAKVFEEFLPVEELLPISQAIGRVFTARGERKMRMKARLKFLVDKLGIEEFRRLVYEEREKLDYDPRWTSYLDHLDTTEEAPLKPPLYLNGGERPDGFNRWYLSNVKRQKQPGYCATHITLPLGDITADQMRGLADICRKYVRDTIRLTVPQNIVLRWVSEGDLVDLYTDLRSLGLHTAGAEGLTDIVACPGTDSCKLGIASSRGLAAELRGRLDSADWDDVRHLSIKISGCPNSCGQHHIADIGFFGSSKRQGGHVAPHFQVVLGGQQAGNAKSYGLAVGKVPSKNVPAFVERLLTLYRTQSEKAESFADFVARLGKARIKNILAEYDQLPDFDSAEELYFDWGRAREFSLQTGTGECAGELVELVQFMLTEADRWLYEASLRFEKGEYATTAQHALQAMVRAADALLTTQGVQSQKPETTLREFRNLFVETKRFHQAAADYIEKWITHEPSEMDKEQAHFAIEEATLFVEEAHGVYGRMQIQQAEKPTRPVREVAPEPAIKAEPVEEIVDSLDLKGVECPFNYVRTKLRLEEMEAGQLLEITIDEGEPIRNVPASLRNDGHSILDTKKIGKHFRLLIRKGA